MTTIIYSLVVFAACTIGSLIGIGGGLIIKPSLDFIGIHGVETVSFISSCAVLAMSLSSTVKHISAKTKVRREIVIFLSLGSVIGGTAGHQLFKLALNGLDGNIVKSIQAIIITAFMIFVVVYVNLKNKKSYNLKNPLLIFLSGILLGIFSAFLGIGGGPVNTAFLAILFSFSVKESTVYSIVIIFFSQLSQMIMIFIQNQFKPYADLLPTIIAVITVAVIGGLIGSYLNKKASDKAITKIYSTIICLVSIINIYNAVNGFTAYFSK